jgi:hypothetical protein
MILRAAYAALITALLVTAERARAAEPAGGVERGVALQVIDCPAADEKAMRAVLSIEIGEIAAAAAVAPDAGAPRPTLVVRCDGEMARIAVAAGGGARAGERALRLGDFPADVAPRAVALAGIELLAAEDPAARWRIDERPAPPPAALAALEPPPANTVASDTPAPPDGPPPPAPAAAPASKEKATAKDPPPPPSPPSVKIDAQAPSAGASRGTAAPWRFAVSGVWRTFMVAEGVSAWGARAAADRAVGPSGWLVFDLEAAGGNVAGPLGDASALLLSTGAFAGERLGGADLGFRVALGARAGLARLAGHGADFSVESGSSLRPWGGPAAAASLVSGRGAVGLQASLEVGIALIGARGLADGTTFIAVGGPWATVGAGIWF